MADNKKKKNKKDPLLTDDVPNKEATDIVTELSETSPKVELSEVPKEETLGSPIEDSNTLGDSSPQEVHESKTPLVPEETTIDGQTEPETNLQKEESSLSSSAEQTLSTTDSIQERDPEVLEILDTTQEIDTQSLETIDNALSSYQNETLTDSNNDASLNQEIESEGSLPEIQTNSEEATSEETTLGEVTSEETSLEEITSEEITSEETITGEITSGETTSVETNFEETTKPEENNSSPEEDDFAVEEPIDLDDLNDEQSLLAELEKIESEIEQLERQAIESIHTQEEDDNFVPETEEEKLALIEVAKLEKEAKKHKADADKLQKEVKQPPENADAFVETYVPEFMREGDQTETPQAPQEVEEEDTEDLQAELERIYETGVAKELDEWDREILLPVFENRLRMSTNPIKLSYSKLKNQILSYKGVSQAFQGPMENFRYNKKIAFRFTIKESTLQLYCDLNPDSIDNSVYPHKKTKSDLGKATPTLLTINDELSLRNATEIVSLVLAKLGAEARDGYVPKAYAERYPLNPDAILLGQEKNAPIEGQYDDEHLYAPISGEIFNGIIEAKFGKDKLQEQKELKGQELLDDIRQTATTIKASVALTEPIVYFFDSALNKEGNIEYINIQQVLNDKFLGKIVPQMFFAVAEGSDRIEKFNFLSLAQAVEQCNNYKNSRFTLALSCRLLIREATFERLLKNAKTEADNLVLAFDCALLESLGNLGLERIRRLRNEAGTMIMIDNSENAGMKVLTDYDFEYIRFDSRFYAQNSPRQKAHLEMMTGYAKSQNIKTTSVNVQTLKEAQTLAERGVDVIQGPAAAEPKRIVTLAMKAIKRLPLS